MPRQETDGRAKHCCSCHRCFENMRHSCPSARRPFVQYTTHSCVLCQPSQFYRYPILKESIKSIAQFFLNTWCPKSVDVKPRFWCGIAGHPVARTRKINGDHESGWLGGHGTERWFSLQMKRPPKTDNFCAPSYATRSKINVVECGSASKRRQSAVLVES